MKLTEIAVIVAVRNEDIFQRRLLASLRDVQVPPDCQVQIVGVTSRAGKAQIYSSAMKESNAKLKVYIDEQCSITNPGLLLDLMKIFESDGDIGACGAVGVKTLPIDGIFEHGTEFVGSGGENSETTDYQLDGLQYEEVVAVDSCIFATVEDIEWRQDLFHDDDFVITAQCFEVKRKGKKVVVPENGADWMGGKIPAHIYRTYAEKATFLKEYGPDYLPLVTVLIPTYNRPEYFRQALESVLNQTYTNLEIVVSDDSDNDLTENTIQPYLLADRRIKYVHHKNFTARDNWDYLDSYDNPDAKYEAWLMDDDLYFPDKIERMVEMYLCNKGIALVTSKRQRIDGAGNELKDEMATKPLVEQTARISGESVGAKMLMELCNYIGEPTTVLIEKKYLREGHIGGFLRGKTAPLGDVNTWLDMLEQGDLIYIREPLTCFRIHANQSQGNVKVFIHALMNWAVLIQHYWHKRKFLVTEKDYRIALFKYLNAVSGYMLQAEITHYDSEDYRLLCSVYSRMAESVDNGYVADLSILDGVWD